MLTRLIEGENEKCWKLQESMEHFKTYYAPVQQIIKDYVGLYKIMYFGFIFATLTIYKDLGRLNISLDDTDRGRCQSGLGSGCGYSRL